MEKDRFFGVIFYQRIKTVNKKFYSEDESIHEYFSDVFYSSAFKAFCEIVKELEKKPDVRIKTVKFYSLDI